VIPKIPSKACVTLHNIFFYVELLAPHPIPQAAGPLFISHPWLLIQFICSYPPYLEDVSSICNLRMGHAMMKGKPLNMVINPITNENVTEGWSNKSHKMFKSTKMVWALWMLLKHCTIIKWPWSQKFHTADYNGYSVDKLIIYHVITYIPS
jgi:hypothetical protein